MGIVEFEEFKGHNMIVIKNGETDRFPFKFGLGKAKKVVENIDAIRKWVDEQEALKAEAAPADMVEPQAAEPVGPPPEDIE